MQQFGACVALSIFLVAPLAGEPMTAGDRQRLVAHLDMTESWLVSELKGLSADQLKFRMTPESWSIADVVEHLEIAEPQYWQRVLDSMKQPPNTEKLTATDAGHPVVRHRSHQSQQDGRGARAEGHHRTTRRRRWPRFASCARRSMELCEEHAGGPAVAEASSRATWTSISGP